MPARTKTAIDTDIRKPGLERIDSEGLTAITPSKFIGEVIVDGETRYYQIEVIAKAIDFNLDAILTERKIIDERKAETKAKSDAKKIRDAKTREVAKAKADAKKAETAE